MPQQITNDVITDGSVNAAKLASPIGGAINESQGADIASASTVNLTTATGNYAVITGTTAITAITLAQGARRIVRFAGALTLTNGASLILPGGANITTAAGDVATFVGEAAGVVRCIQYMRASGQAIVASGGITLGTQVNSTSGTSIDITGIPSTARRVTLIFNGVSLSGTGLPLIQLGTSSSVETTGYLGSVSSAGGTSQPFSTGFQTANGGGGTGAALLRYAQFIFTNMTGNTWVMSGIEAQGTTANNNYCAGTKSLSAVLDRIRITTTTGTDTFDAGTINIVYE